MSGDLNFLLNVAVQSATALPVADRIRVYRGAAIVMGDGEQAASLLRLATELETVDQRCFEFARQFRQQPLFPGGAR